jgi:hypothetical protein
VIGTGVTPRVCEGIATRRSADRVVQLLQCRTGELELFRLGAVVQGRHRGGGQLGLLLVECDGAVDPLDADRLGRRISGTVRQLIQDLLDLGLDLGPARIVAVVLGELVGLVQCLDQVEDGQLLGTVARTVVCRGATRKRAVGTGPSDPAS